MNVVSSPPSPFPLLCFGVVALVDSLAYFHVASQDLISFMGIRFKLNDFLIISEVILFSLGLLSPLTVS